MPRAASPLTCRSVVLALAAALTVACSPAPEAPSTPGAPAARPEATDPTPPATVVLPRGDLEAVALEVGARLDAEGRVATPQERFRPADTVYASLVTVGTSPAARLRVEWRNAAGAVLAADERAVAPAGAAVHTFSRAVEGGWSPGRYAVGVRIGDQDAGERTFEVR